MLFSTRSRALMLATLALGMVVSLPMGQAAPGGKAPAKTDADEEGEPEPATGGAAAEVPAGDANDAVLTPAVEELLTIRPCRVVGGVANLAYSLSDPAEANDFESTGFDKVELHQVMGSRMASEMGLELGAGSSQVGRLRHKLPLAGTFTIEVELWAAHAAPSSIVCFGISEKVGVLWGQQIVKPSSLKPWSKSQPAADPSIFGAERSVRAKITATNGMEVTVECNGRRVAAHRFTKGELKNARFAVFARNCRLVVTDLQIKAQIDGAKL